VAKNKDDVEAEEFAEVPGRGVDGVAVGEQDDGGEGEERGLLPGERPVEACADECVSAGF
jgi:hypothetical protein